MLTLNAHACRVLSLPFVRLHASEDLTLASNISDLFLAVGQSFQQDVPAAVQCSAAAVSAMIS